ncbi:amino acid ABC transporter substrate-binding protein [Suttonella sp. R2A3]|uniref:amino acid ABC transporter substrate-binding protein n=1 Tax=Suttonella sp. R2A3 TaxID=2908648 RepID=UPI001F21CA9A|nr:amino acid ABC transporter substrate-binding protein [Suttonella sp. R2A3]UJF24719.1 amino acid ABC transporter substrate-binding protein [Suttonella sp. R2A3]
MKKTLLSLALLAAASAQAGTLDDIKKRGELRCGVTQALPGFSVADDQGQWKGLDVDYCRALAVAIFDDPNKVAFRPTSSKERFSVLQSGEIDVLARVTTWTTQRDVDLGFDFIGTNYYDGQGFMVRKDLGVSSVNELSGASICTNTGTSTEVNMSDYFKSHDMDYNPVIFEKSEEVKTAYDNGRCDVYSSDVSGLYVQREQLQDPSAHIILPEVISKEPLGPVVRQDDAQFKDLASWTHFCMVNAEEMGITQANISEKLTSENPNVRRLLGLETNGSAKLGVGEDFCQRIVANVGNYGESFARNVGKDSQLKIERGLNNLWSNGGIMYAPPLR